MAALFVVVLSLYFLITGAQQNGDVRLRDGSPYTGRVEVYMESEWGTVQYDSTYDQEGVARTICTQLGYGDQTSYGTVEDLNIPPADGSVPVHISALCTWRVSPYNTEQHILRCNYYTPDIPDHQNDMAVTCSPIPDSLYYYDTQVRLQRNSSTEFQSSSGFLEVYLNGAWGPVCNMYDDDVDTACRQIGYTSGSVYSDKSGYQNSFRDKLSYFYCSWSNACLKSCFNYPTADDTFYCQGQHTHITCTFDESEQSQWTSGSSLLCSNAAGLIALIVGVAFAMLFLMVLVIAVPVVVCCCCIPGCIFNSFRKRGGYHVVS